MTAACSSRPPSRPICRPTTRSCARSCSCPSSPCRNSPTWTKRSGAATPCAMASPPASMARTRRSCGSSSTAARPACSMPTAAAAPPPAPGPASRASAAGKARAPPARAGSAPITCRNSCASSRRRCGGGSNIHGMDAEFLPAGIDRAALKPLARRSDRAGLIRLAGHAGTLAGTGALVLLAAGQPLLLIPAMALHGAAFIFLFAPLHETIHRTAFRSRRLNDAVAFVCGLFLLLPPDYFRAFHFAHHRWTQDTTRDPELAGGGRPASRGAFLLYLSGLPY